MNQVDNIFLKRAMLLSTKMTFTPNIQPIKETAIDTIIEQLLFLHHNEVNDAEMISKIIADENDGVTLNIFDIKNSIDRLKSKKRIYFSDEQYNLSDYSLREISRLQEQAIGQINSVSGKLFQNQECGAESCVEAFLKCLAIIFSRLGEETLQVIKGDITKIKKPITSYISDAITTIRTEFSSVDINLFGKSIASFFETIDPEYNIIKWNMAQNYYISKAVGLDPDRTLISNELFTGAIFYLDTNILIAALNPRDKLHASFKALAKICTDLKISLKASTISISELTNWVLYQRTLLTKVTDQIPTSMSSTINSTFYEDYIEKSKISCNDAINIDEIFQAFGSVAVDLKSLGVQVEDDDTWALQNKLDPALKEFASQLQNRYHEFQRKEKSKEAALHDALILNRIQKLRGDRRNTWLITNDMSLPGAAPGSNNSTSIAMTLGVLLQWIAPFANQGDEQRNSFSQIFAGMIKHRILPQNKIFDLQDFVIFHEMHMACKDLPAEDVEGCINYIKNNVPKLDPSDPADREKLGYEISKFFAAPNRKYKQEISRLESENTGLKTKYEKDLGDIMEQMKDLQSQINREKTKREDEAKEITLKHTESIVNLRTEFEQNLKEKDAENQENLLKKSTKTRLYHTFIFSVVGTLIFILLVAKYGEGSNLLQKIKGYWEIIIMISVGLFFILGVIFIGQKRLRYLPWPFSLFFKDFKDNG